MIPIAIGVTGHRDLRNEDLPKLTELVRIELSKMKEQCPNSAFVMLNSLASGADQLCAKTGLELGIELVCPLPMSKEKMAALASPEETEEFNIIAEKASEVFAVPFTESEPPELTNDFYYRQAGIYIASHCHVLLALWDGTAPDPDGCGTAEAVSFMKDNSYLHSNSSLFKARDDGAVIQIVTPRSINPFPEAAFSVRLIENNTGALTSMLKQTDLFNKEVKTISAKASYDLIDASVIENSGQGTKRLHETYKQADSLSVYFRDKYLGTLKWLSVLGMIMVLAFLFYDEMESNLFLIVYGAVLLSTFITWRFSTQSEMQRKYLEYRALTETLRVQFFLQLRGIGTNICDSLTWSQKNDSVWVKKAVSVLLAGEKQSVSADIQTIKTAWIDGQLAYHKKTVIRDERSNKINDRMTNLLLIISATVFTIVVILEFTAAGKLALVIDTAPVHGLFMMHPGQDIYLRGLLKILLGIIPAFTIFLSGYYGKLSLSRKVAEHQRMIALYTLAQKKFEDPKLDKDTVFFELAREEVIENGSWLSFCRDNIPSINF